MSTDIVVMPKLVVTIEGKVTSSNLPAFQKAAKKYVTQINRVFTTDEDFGQAEVDIKSLKEAEKLVKTSAENIVNQTHDINEVLKTLSFIGEEFRQPRLEIERDVKEQKDSIRIKLMKEASDEITEHDHKYVDQINTTEFPLELKYATPDFFAAIKGLRTIESVKDGIKKEKDAAILAMTTVANDLLAKLAWLRENDFMKWKHLFGDMPYIIHKEIEGFKAMVQLRVTKHIADEKEKEEKQREKIRIEEEAKAKAKVEAEAKAKAEAEERAIAAQKLAEKPRQTEPTAEVKEIPAPAVPRQITEEENSERITHIRTARTLCDTFLALTMSLEEAAKIRHEMLTFLQKTDWVE